MQKDRVSKTRDSLKSRAWILKMISLPIFILIWYVLSLWLGYFRLPSPLTVFQEIITTLVASTKMNMAGAGTHGFYPHIIATFLKVTIGYTFGSLLGLLMGILIKISKRLYYAIHIPLDILRSIPPIAFVPIFFLLLGRSLLVQMLAIILYSFLTIVINTISAIENVPPIYQRYAMTLGASRSRVYKDVILPSIIPELIGAFRVGIIWAWGYEVIIEQMGAESGIGKVFFYTKFINALDLVVVGVIWVILLAGITDIILGLLFTQTTKWQEKIRKGVVEAA